jgi:DNA-binding NarL/FixJ family response regulator
VTVPDAAIFARQRPISVVLDIADRAVYADIADACDEAGIRVAMSSGEADVAIIDRPLTTALPAIALASEGTHRAWPPNVCAVVPADMDAATLSAVIAVVAAGFTLARRGTPEGQQDEADEMEDAAGPSTEPGHDAGGEPADVLSAREREVLELLAGGASNKEIARVLGLSLSTVKFHVAGIIGKLGARSRVDAVAIAIRAGLVMM